MLFGDKLMSYFVPVDFIELCVLVNLLKRIFWLWLLVLLSWIAVTDSIEDKLSFIAYWKNIVILTEKCSVYISFMLTWQLKQYLWFQTVYDSRWIWLTNT